MDFWSFSLEMLVAQGLLTKLVMELKWTETQLPFGFVWMVNCACSLFCILIIGGIYEAAYFFSQYKTAIQKADQLKKEQAKQRLEALKNRVNPHFLFNSLTTLSALIGEDAPRAERFVDELSKVYRHLLRAGRQPTMTLEEELKFVQSYAFLMENRFGQKEFSFTLATDTLQPSKSEKQPAAVVLPALSLQNAVDYLVRTQHMPLKIVLTASAGELQIACDHHPKTLAFDTSDNDWRQLEMHHARTQIKAGQFMLHIPVTINKSGV